VKEANQNSNTRIDQLVNKLKSLGLKRKDIYVDFISETKVYDHHIEGNEINEFFEGFSLRRNLIVKVKELSLIHKIIDLAAEQEIHDLVKVDYLVEDLEAINDKLFEEAMKIASKRKKDFNSQVL